MNIILKSKILRIFVCMIIIRKSRIEDLPEIMPIYDCARRFMAGTGNPNQWINGYPAETDILRDIENDCHYVIEHDNDGIVGAFMFRIGNDPTYDVIEGAWLNDDKYGVIHRLASNGKHKGIAKMCFDYCFTKIRTIRVDTHHENKVMQNGILQYGFTPCGTIYCHNGSPRLAYQRTLE